MLETPPVGTEVVALREASGRVLAAPFAASEDLPVHARSVMDGYAVRAADVAAATSRRPRSCALPAWCRWARRSAAPSAPARRSASRPAASCPTALTRW